jgi:nucleotide-binding universal stress UspA family protein
MFNKILYPTDFSDIAEKAYAYIKQLQGAGMKEVVLLHVIDHRSFEVLAAHDSAMRAKDIEQKIEEESLKEMNKTAEELEKNGLIVSVRLVKGVPFCEILNVAEEEDVDAIVVGSHGKSNVAEMLLGSVSEKVIRKAKRPVLVVKR